MNAEQPVLAYACHRRRPLVALGGLLAVILVLAWFTAPPRPTSPAGLWVVSQRQLDQVNAGVLPRTGFLSWLFAPKGPDAPQTLHGGPDPFRFDGETVCGRMHRLHPWEVGPADNIWRLRARWEGTNLCCLWPGGSWGKLATFVDGRFQIEQGGIRWVLEKADPDNFAEPLQPFMKKDRPVWHYPPLTFDFDEAERVRRRIPDTSGPRAVALPLAAAAEAAFDDRQCLQARPRPIRLTAGRELPPENSDATRPGHAGRHSSRLPLFR